MTKEEIIAKAKRDYPIGTKYLCDGHVCTLKSHKFDSPSFLSNVGEFHIYYEGEWAEIIELPKVKNDEPLSPKEAANRFLCENGQYISPNDIVVSLSRCLPHRTEGQMFRVHDTNRNSMYYKTRTSSSQKEAWRKATTEEKTNFLKGAENIHDIIKPSKDEILAAAKRMFPKGTRHSGSLGFIHPAPDPHKYIVEGELYWAGNIIYSRGQAGAIYCGANKGQEWALIHDSSIRRSTHVIIPSALSEAIKDGPGIREQLKTATSSRKKIKIAKIITSKRNKKRRLIN
jgi:hypothetical protein